MEIKEVNHNDLAFFAGIEVYEAKQYIAGVLKITDRTPTGLLKVGKKDVIKPSDYDFSMKSNSRLDGESSLKYLVDYYTKGRADKNELRGYAQEKSFIKQIQFTGKHEILNKILCRKQYRTLQKRWLQTNVMYSYYWSDSAIKFIRQRKAFAIVALHDIGIDEAKINQELEYADQKSSKKHAESNRQIQ